MPISDSERIADNGAYRLLAADEPPALIEERALGRGNFLLAVDHAGRRIPRRLGGLGLPPQELERHIAWDIGSLALARRVAAALDAPLVAQAYSRLVIDCNRDPAIATSIKGLMVAGLELQIHVGWRSQLRLFRG